jgi:uncharacterized protein YbjQ (UPF0145 family)
MIITNLEYLPGKVVKRQVEIVSGSCVMTKHIFWGIFALFKGLFGGELKEYADTIQQAREKAIERMKLEAAEKGANAILNIHFSTSAIYLGAVEIYAYGTAVEIKEDDIDSL